MCVLFFASLVIFKFIPEMAHDVKSNVNQQFDKQYYEEIFLNSWQPRNIDESFQDWTTGSASDSVTRMMLNTDLCLVFDIEHHLPCCTSNDVLDPNGDDTCIDAVAAQNKCPMLSNTHSRFEALETVEEMLGGSYPNTNNVPFYSAFTDSWSKATTLGWKNLFPLAESCA